MNNSSSLPPDGSLTHQQGGNVSLIHQGGDGSYDNPATIYIRWVDLLIGSVGLCIGIYSLIVNAIIMAILVRMTRRSVSDTVFCHLAVTDIAASFDAIFAFSILLSDRTYFNFYFFDDIVCQFVGITWCVVSILTPLLLSVISFGRFIALYIPHRYDKFYSPPLSTILIISSWIISVIGGTMHVWKLENMRMEPKWGYCDYRLVDIYTKTEVRYIVIFLYSLPLSVSTAILLVCNMAVAFRLIRVQSKRKLMLLLSFCTPSSKGISDTVVFSNAPTDTIESRGGGASLEFELTVTEQYNSTVVMGEHSAVSTVKRSNKVTPSPNSQKQKGRKNNKRRRKEKQVIIATLLFSLNFGCCYFVMLYYYFSYMIYPTHSVFDHLSKKDRVRETYILGWFYYATFLSSSINPIIHFSCNSKMRAGAKSLFRHLRNKLSSVLSGS